MVLLLPLLLKKLTLFNKLQETVRTIIVAVQHGNGTGIVHPAVNFMRL